MNEYYNKLKTFQREVIKYTSEIFKVYGNELLLRLEEYNLLTNQYNCIETSTSIGFIIEEFIVSKLEIYTQQHNNNDNYKINRSAGSTTKASYDCFGFIDGIKIMINIKVDKGGNNAISAIKMLYEDYVLNEPQQE